LEGVNELKKLKYFIIPGIFVIIFGFLNFYTLPYYITKPGMAKELDTVIEVMNGDEADGKFMLTTVWVAKANILGYLLAQFNEFHKIDPIENIRSEDETDEEYNVRQMYLMENSQENALQVAFRYANKPINIKYKGVYVLKVFEGYPAYEVLKAGDRIVSIDNQEFETQNDFINYIQSKKEGDSILVTYYRGDKKFENSITLKLLPQTDKDEPAKPGIGISLVEDKELETNPKVVIDSRDIGGPSAGLMFTLEIYNQLTEGDLTKGYRIAGTGTIDPEGNVGPIGGIDLKIVAADKEGAEIFFAPNEKGDPNSDYQNALKTAKKINSKMKIVPVDTFEDALKFLENLEPKN